MSATLVIDNVEYAFPTRDTFTMAEARTLKRYTGLTLNQLADDPDTGEPGVDPSDPDLIAALIHIAFARAEPGLSFAQIEQAVDAVKFAQIAAGDDEQDGEGDALPPPSGTGSRASSGSTSTRSGGRGKTAGATSPAAASRGSSGTEGSA